MLFPIWHNITEAEIRAYRASLSNIVALSTATHTVQEIANEIFEVISDFDVPDIKE